MVSSIGYSLGIGSGLDINKLIEGLAAAERAPKEALIKRREETNSARITALADAAAGIDSFAKALTGLVSGGSLFSQPSVSDPTIISATTIAGTRLATLSAEIEVLQLAKSQTLHSDLLTGTSEPVGQGDLTITTSSGSFVVTIDSANDSLGGLATAINAQKAGVTASIVTDQNGARIVLKGTTGEANAYTLSVAAGTATGLERFTYDPVVAGGMTRTQAAQDAVVRLDGLDVKRSSNSFGDLIEGVQIDLKRAAPNSPVTLGVTRPTAAIEQAVNDFVEAYNEIHKALTAATAAGQNGVGSGPLRGDLSIREMQRQLAQLPGMVLSSQGSIKTLAEVGVATNRDGTLSLNNARLSDALKADPLGVEGLFNPVQYSSSPLVRISSAMGKTKPGTYPLTDLAPETAGVPASGNFDGLAGIGYGSFLRAPQESAALGLVVEVTGPIGSATITVDPGLGGALQAIRDTLRARSGPIVKSQERLNEEAQQITKDRAALEARAATRREQLVTSFTRMERQVSALKATQSYLEQQMKVWAGNSD